MENKTIDIFIKSYAKDFPLLKYSLLSIEKYLTGYNKIHIVIPNKDKYLFYINHLADSTKERIVLHLSNDYGNGYLYQQLIKMSAHKYCQSDFIMYSDSDVIFSQHQNLQDLVSTGMPEILYTDYSLVGDALCWKECTDKFIGQPQQFEFMRRLGLIYHRSTVENIYNSKPNLEAYIMNSDRFSEFNAMGAWAFKNEPQNYDFINTNKWQYKAPYFEQLWSHADNNGGELHKQEYARMREVIKRTLGIEI